VEQSSKSLKLLLGASGLFLAGLLAGKILFGGHGFDNPRLVTVEGKAIYLKDAEAGMSEAERTGNSIELKKQMAMNMVQDKILNELAAKEGLSVPDFIRKVKDGADSKISEDEFKTYVHDNFPREKYTPAQLKNFRAGLQERKRGEYFREFMKKAMADAHVQWDL
jgi:hypothetical protein